MTAECARILREQHLEQCLAGSLRRCGRWRLTKKARRYEKHQDRDNKTRPKHKRPPDVELREARLYPETLQVVRSLCYPLSASRPACLPDSSPRATDTASGLLVPSSFGSSGLKF